jgi:hypothetical protein
MSSPSERDLSGPRPITFAPIGVAAVSLGVFVIALLALHVLRTDLNPVADFVSEYAVGDSGALMVIALLAMGLASLALIAGLRAALPGHARSRAGMILIGVWAAGTPVLAAFPIGVDETIDTTADVIHRLTALIAFLAVSIGALLVSRSFRRDAAWRTLARPGIVLSAALLVGYVATFGGYAVDSGFEGMSQRLFLAVLVAWMGMAIWRIQAIRENAS